MRSNKYLLVVLSVFLISLVFIASASATDVNETTEVLSIDESTNILNNGTDALDYSSDNTVSNDNIAVNPKTDIIVRADNVTKYYGGLEMFGVSVSETHPFADESGNYTIQFPIAGVSVNITINGVTYTRVTGGIGSTGIPLNLNSGVYGVTVDVENITVQSLVTILSTVNGTDVVKMYGNGTKYYATFIDTNGKYLADGTDVKFNINGIEYIRKIAGGKGQAGLNINLPQGEYLITTINPVNSEMHANNITVLPTIVDNRDITKYYRNGTQYSVKVLGADGKVVGNGEIVTFNINGVFYNRTTNETGHAKLNINLNPGEYIITAEYKGCKVSNKIKVKSILSAEDLTKKYGTPDQFKAKLVDGEGNPLANTNVTFNINGVFYNRTTDSDGIAKLNIRLMPGEYIITSSYNECYISNKITVVPAVIGPGIYVPEDAKLIFEDDDIQIYDNGMQVVKYNSDESIAV